MRDKLKTLKKRFKTREFRIILKINSQKFKEK